MGKIKAEKENFDHFQILIGCMIASYLIIWSPLSVITIMNLFHFRPNNMVVYVMGYIPKLGGVVNPVLYVVFNKEVSTETLTYLLYLSLTIMIFF